jgi:hypothetical protein
MFFIAFSAIAYGDLYWANLVVSGGEPVILPKNIPKQVREQMLKEFKSTTETERCFLTSYGFRTERKDHIIIIEHDTMIMYQLNPLEKTYTKVDMKAEMEGMAKEMAEDSRITPTDETKKIAGYNCRKYIATIMDAENEYWHQRRLRDIKSIRQLVTRCCRRIRSWEK